MTSRRDEYTAKVEQQLHVLNDKIDQLEVQARAAHEDGRETYRAELLKLRQHSAHAIDKLIQVKSASDESWDSIVSEMDKVTAAFTHSFRYFKSQFRLPMSSLQSSAAGTAAKLPVYAASSER